MRYLKILMIIILSAYLVSCETEIDLELDDAGKAIVVEGVINEGELPILTLTSTYSFYDQITINSFDSLFVDGAKILVWVDQDTIELKENNIEFEGFSYVFYKPDSNASNIDKFYGTRGKTYHLQIQINEETYTASTYLPHQTKYDSIWYEPHPESEKYPELVQVYISTSDADTIGNKYRVFTKRNNEEFYTENGSIFDDSVFNGTSFERPVNRAPIPLEEDDDLEKYGYFNRGDEVTIRRGGIDQGVFDFFATLEFNAQGGGGPFGSTTVIESNIKGSENIIGVWAGYSIEEISISIPD